MKQWKQDKFKFLKKFTIYICEKYDYSFVWLWTMGLIRTTWCAYTSLTQGENDRFQRVPRVSL